MAKGKTAGMQKATYGLSGSWFWLALSFAATLYLRFSPARQGTVVDAFFDYTLFLGLAVVLWSLAGRALGALLRAATPGTDPAWVFRLSGWTLATLAAGILIALQAGDDPRSIARAENLPELLLPMAAMGLAWLLLIDVSRALLARLARRSETPFFSAGTIAFVLGLAGLAWTVWLHREGTLEKPPIDAGLGALGVALAAGVVLTLIVELPRALIARNRGENGASRPDLAQARSRLVGTLRNAAARPAAPAEKRASALHGRIETPPTVVRRR